MRVSRRQGPEWASRAAEDGAWWPPMLRQAGAMHLHKGAADAHHGDLLVEKLRGAQAGEREDRHADGGLLRVGQQVAAALRVRAQRRQRAERRARVDELRGARVAVTEHARVALGALVRQRQQLEEHEQLAAALPHHDRRPGRMRAGCGSAGGGVR